MEKKYSDIEPNFDAPDLAVIFKCTTETVWKKCRTGEWPHMKLGRNYLFSASDVHEIQELMRPKKVPRKTRKREAL